MAAKNSKGTIGDTQNNTTSSSMKKQQSLTSLASDMSLNLIDGLGGGTNKNMVKCAVVGGPKVGKSSLVQAILEKVRFFTVDVQFLFSSPKSILGKREQLSKPQRSASVHFLSMLIPFLLP